VHLGDLFREAFVNKRDAVGLEHTGADGALTALTFGQIDAHANRFAHALRARGVVAGDRVCLYLPNSAAFIEVFLACLRIGAVVVPVNVMYRERELSHIVTDAAPRLVIAESDAPGAQGVVALSMLAAEAASCAHAAIAHAVNATDAAAIIYTSGTTGRSKGAVLSHANFVANARALIDSWRITGDDRYLAVLPLFHVHGLGNGVCAWLASGCRMRLEARFDQATIAEVFDAFTPTLFFGVPTMYVRLLDLPPDRAARIGARMRLFVSGSAPLPAHVHAAFHERFGHTILERYGMSEALMITSNPYAGDRRPGTVGVPLPGVSVRIGPPHEADAGPGELYVRGASVFSGYWKNPDTTASAFDDGWFRTGDIAERSPDGYYTLCGRATDLIICNGYNVYPREIEEFLQAQPGVREAAVVGAPDALRGEVPIAYLVADDAIDGDALRAACAGAFAAFKLPRAFIRIDALPRNALGKVQKHLLPAPT
jgi:malonyl-CoA/methylmalonyl-CoA synthetase